MLMYSTVAFAEWCTVKVMFRSTVPLPRQTRADWHVLASNKGRMQVTCTPASKTNSSKQQKTLQDSTKSGQLPASSKRCIAPNDQEKGKIENHTTS